MKEYEKNENTACKLCKPSVGACSLMLSCCWAIFSLEMFERSPFSLDSNGFHVFLIVFVVRKIHTLLWGPYRDYLIFRARTRFHGHVWHVCWWTSLLALYYDSSLAFICWMTIESDPGLVQGGGFRNCWRGSASPPILWWERKVSFISHLYKVSLKFGTAQHVMGMWAWPKF